MSARFGRYELLRPLGRGGMAEVFLARFVGPEGFEKRLVIKRVLPQLSDDTRLLRMFFEEARTHVSLSHGNLVSVFDFGRVGNDYFIAMEHVSGVDFATLLSAEREAGRKLPPSLVAQIGVEVCRGLAYVHRRGFVHRDVSPRNILLSVDGEVKLSDFGLVLSATSDGSGVRGTLAYTSPEQARAERVDGRSDLYSLGVVLAEALLGHTPRGAAGVLEMLEVAKEGASIKVEGPLADVIARATSTRADDRFASAEEMLAAIERAAIGLGGGREEAVQKLAAHVEALPQSQATPIPFEAPAVIAPTADAFIPATADLRARGAKDGVAETYFRDHASTTFVEDVLEGRAPQERRRPWLFVLPIVLFSFVLGYRALRRQHVVVQDPRPASTKTEIADLAIAVQIVPVAVPVVALPAATPRAPKESNGTLNIKCSPWCVPYVDGVVRGEDGRSHTLTLPAGKHRIEVHRLDDRRSRMIQVRSDRAQTVEFDFQAKFD